MFGKSFWGAVKHSNTACTSSLPATGTPHGNYRVHGIVAVPRSVYASRSYSLAKRLECTGTT